jgi:hypothetical protein
MSEPRIGRVLVASLHQAIADVLPARLEFYENWLNPHGLREGTIGLAPLSAVLSFLRREGEAYAAVTTRAGEYAGEWSVRSLPAMRRRLISALPGPLRSRAALRAARTLVRDTYPGSRAIIRVKRGNVSVDLRGSLFCEVREASALPLCGFYAAAITRILESFAIPATAELVGCRSSLTRRGCAMSVTLGRRREVEVERPEHAA